MSTKIDKQWKDAFLKTSVPLEYLVAEQLSDLRCGIQGEYHYVRPNEEGVPTEFSVDIWAVTHLFKKDIGMWADLNFLIECKYCYPGIKWLFAPLPKTATEHLSEPGIVHTLDELCTRQIMDKRPLWNLSNRFHRCFKGVELLPKDATIQNIEKGRSQLMYAMPRFAIHLSGSQTIPFHDEDLQISFICPILITTADLYVLKKGLKLNDFKNANSPEDIATQVQALILTNPYSQLFNDYTDNLISAMHLKSPKIKERLEQLQTLKDKLTGEDNSRIPASFSFDWNIRESSTRILIVNYNHLEDIYKLIRQTVVRAGKNLKQIGVLQKDISKMKTWIVEIK
ncbi:MAG: hypothetical protein WA126_16025 [Thermodesulfovibrionales bacterium]